MYDYFIDFEDPVAAARYIMEVNYVCRRPSDLI